MPTISHGMSKTLTYKSWQAMIRRCTYPSTGRIYRSYGARGVTVCTRWKESFEAFLEDLGERPSAKHSLDRIDGSGNYEPGNCRWATSAEQSRNKRNNVFLEYKGKRQTYTDWSKDLGIPKMTIFGRLKRGLSVQEALQSK